MGERDGEEVRGWEKGKEGKLELICKMRKEF